MGVPTLPMKKSKSAEQDRCLEEVLRQALEFPAVERSSAMLALGHDPTVVDKAMALLEEEDQRFLAGPAAPSITPDSALPKIPGYRVLSSLGEGGMGQVFLAEEDNETGRRVAIKRVRAHLMGPELFERFAAEHQALARLNHPAIAQLYAADTTTMGPRSTAQPFVVMEYVDGEPVTSFCDRRRLTIRERLRIFLAICRGLEHAHRRFLLHRDLKPSNLLVTRRDGEDLPKIIDFGIAKAFDESQNGSVSLGRLVSGTPAYMSPEALKPVDGPRDLDIRADVYSLGVVLYELLVGARPHGVATDDPKLRSRIVNRDPARPSARWRALDADRRARAATVRGLTANDSALALGDLDWIVMKAIARDRDCRYGSVGDLAADIERYLGHHPIEARPTSLGYRLSCLVRRERKMMLAAALVALSLVLGVVGATLGMVRAQEAEAEARAEALRATRESQTASRVSDLLIDLFAVVDPDKGGPSTSMEVGELLDRGSTKIRAELEEDPAIQARLMSVLGNIYRVVGDYERARDYLEQALKLMQEDPARDAYRLGQTLNHLALLDRSVGHFEEAVAKLGRASVLWQEAFGPEHPKVAGLLNNRGNALRDLGRYEEASLSLEQALRIWKAAAGPEDRNVAIAALNLGNVWNQLGRDEEALASYREAGRILQGLVGPDHPYLGVVSQNVGDALGDLGRHEEAEAALREALRIRRSALGPDHDYTLRTQHYLGQNLLAQGQVDAADSLIFEALEKLERIHGGEHPEVAIALKSLSQVRRQQGESEQALALAQRAVRILESQTEWQEVYLQEALQALESARLAVGMPEA